MTIAAETNRGLIREVNEDSLFAKDGLLIVADGMGGHNGGEIASRMAVEAVRGELRVCGDVTAFEIDAALQEANRRIYTAACKNDTLKGMGTTLTMAVIRKDIATIAHIGDSRAYLMRNGRLTRLTRDHSLVEELVRNGYITREQAAGHPHRHVITRALGTDTRILVDQKRVGVQPGDRLLLCTDGIMLHVSDEEIEEALLQQGSEEQHAGRLLSIALERGGEDNITIILALIDGRDTF